MLPDSVSKGDMVRSYIDCSGPQDRVTARKLPLGKFLVSANSKVEPRGDLGDFSYQKYSGTLCQC